VNLPVDAVVAPMAPGEVNVAPLRDEALRLGTFVVEVTVSGAVPSATDTVILPTFKVEELATPPEFSILNVGVAVLLCTISNTAPPEAVKWLDVVVASNEFAEPEVVIEPALIVPVTFKSPDIDTLPVVPAIVIPTAPAAVRRRSFDPPVPVEYTEDPPPFNNKPAPAGLIAIEPLTSTYVANIEEPDTCPIKPGEPNVAPLSVEAFRLATFAEEVVARVVNDPVLGVVDPIGPGAANVALFRVEAFSKGTFVEEATVNGTPVVAVDTSVGAVNDPVTVVFPVVPAIVIPTSPSAVRRKFLVPITVPIEYIAAPSSFNSKADPSVFILIGPSHSMYEAVTVSLHTFPIGPGDENVVPLSVEAFRLATFAEEVVARVVNDPDDGVVEPIGPGAANVALLRDDAFSKGTFVVEDTVSGGPVVAVDTSVGAVNDPVTVVLPVVPAIVIPTAPAAVKRKSVDPPEPVEYTEEPPAFNSKPDPALFMAIAPLDSIPVANIWALVSPPIIPGAANVAPSRVEAFKLSTFVVDVVARVVNDPDDGVVDPIGPGAANVALLRVEAFSKGTFVAELIVSGAVPVSTVLLIGNAVSRPVSVILARTTLSVINLIFLPAPVTSISTPKASSVVRILP
jgi:hypothetical protein